MSWQLARKSCSVDACRDIVQVLRSLKGSNKEVVGSMEVCRALLIKPKYLALILRGTKTAELRRTPCKKLHWTALSPLGGKRGSKRKILGLATITSSEKVTMEEILRRKAEHCVEEAEVRAYLGDKEGYLWTLSEKHILSNPLEFDYIRGQVNFAKLGAEVVDAARNDYMIEGSQEEKLQAAESYLSTLHSCGLPSRSKSVKKTSCKQKNKLGSPCA